MFRAHQQPTVKCTIWFKKSRFNSGIMSSMSQQRQTLRSFILQVFFHSQRLLQPREQLQHQQQDLQNQQIFRFNHLQDYLNLSRSRERRSLFSPSDFEINVIKSLKEGFLEINEKSINSNQSEIDQELQLLQDLRLQEWYQGDLQDYSEKDVKAAIKKQLILSVTQVTKWSSSSQASFSRNQAKVIESRWVIRPRAGVLKATSKDSVSTIWRLKRQQCHECPWPISRTSSGLWLYGWQQAHWVQVQELTAVYRSGCHPGRQD